MKKGKIEVQFKGDDLRMRAREARERRRIDISGPLQALTEKLGETYGLVAEFRITPAEVLVTVFTPNDEGRSHVNERGWAAMEQHRYDVRT